ncbi:MAG: hypothetical protein ABJN04_09575 [Hyphomicrobiales bacterium]
MWKKFESSVRGGASIEYALFLSAMAIMVVSGVAVLGDQFKPQIIAWREGFKPVEIDYVTTASTSKKQGELTTDVQIDGDTKTYRVYKLPKGLE